MQEDQILDNLTVDTSNIKEFNYPLSFEFKLGTLANDFIAKDRNEKTIAYVRQKMFKLKEDILIYSDESQDKVLYRIQANKVIDFSAAYLFTNANNENIGKVARKGMKSIWKAHYNIFDNENNIEYSINEENPWIKILDGLFSEIPILGIFTGYVFNPKYIVKDKSGNLIARLIKEKSLFGKKFTVERLSDFNVEDSERILLSLMMMILLEKRRG